MQASSGIEWRCQSCRCTPYPDFNALPVAESTRIDDPIHNQSGSVGNASEESNNPSSRNSSEEFNNLSSRNSSEESNPSGEESHDWSGGNPSDDFSLDDPSIHEQDSSFALTYEIIEQSSKRGRK